MCGAPERTHPISAEARLGCFWVAGQSTHGLGRAGVGISVKGRVTPDGDHPLPPLSVRGLGFNAFVSGPHRLRGTLPYGHQPHCPPQATANARVREGRGRGSDPSGHARFPSAVAGVATPATRVSRGNGVGISPEATATVVTSQVLEVRSCIVAHCMGAVGSRGARVACSPPLAASSSRLHLSDLT